MTDDEYVIWLQSFEDWYDRAVSRWHFLLMFCRTLTVAATIFAAFLAALMSKENLSTFKWIVAGSSLVGASSAHLLAEFRVVKMEALREAGRAEAQHLVAYARDKLDQFKNDPKKYFGVKDEIRERLRHLEETQGREFAQVHQGQSPQTETIL